jgi:murein DD-endopeptidase MepM/ murein hydrolase activator NlpD
MNIWRPLFKFAFIFFPLYLYSQTEYPEIKSTYIYRDNLFKQQQNALNQSQTIIARLTGAGLNKEEADQLKNRLKGEILFFSYHIHEGDTIYTVAADFSLSADTLASLNGLERAAYIDNKEDLIIPSIPGLYIREAGGNELERRMRENHESYDFFYPLTLKINGVKQSFLFYPNLSFTGSERLYFISLPFRSPLDHYWEITSSYGMRVHPITGSWEQHNGIDVRAPLRTPVFSAEKGTVIKTTELDNYGIIIIIEHRGGYETRYAHLDEIFVKEGDFVERGQMIARSGNTGLSTGPHLHFEIRRNGQPIDPVRLVSQGSR